MKAYKLTLIIGMALLFTILSVPLRSQTFTNSTSTNIPSGNTTCVPVNVSGIGNISDSYGLEEVCIDLAIDVTYDVYISLQAPDGTTYYLYYNDGFVSGSDMSVTCFNSSAISPIWTASPPYNGSYQPETNLGGFNNGMDADGTWYICIENATGIYDGTLSSASITFSSSPSTACGAIANDDCFSSPLICDFNGYCGTTSGYYTVPAGQDDDINGCGYSLNNNSWVEFVPNNSSVSIDVTVSDCADDSGVQFGVWESADCNTFTHVDCGPANPLIGSHTMNFTGLTVGNSYYLMIDGYAGDVCNYSFSVDGGSGVTVVDIQEGDDLDVCPGDDISLNVTDLPNVTFDWAWPTGTDSGTSISINSVTPPFDVVVTATGACNSVTDTIRINQATDCCTADAGSDVEVCANESVTLTASGGGTYSWSDGVSQGVAFSPAATNTYTVTVDDGAGCTVTDDVLVTVNPLPVADAGSDEELNCALTSLNLDGSSSSSGADFIYNWSTSGGNILSGATTDSPLVDAAGNYTLTVSNTNTGCTAEDQTTITQDIAAPVADAGPDQVITCTTTEVQLDGTASSSGADIQYSWSTVDGNILSGFSGSISTVNQAGSYSLQVTDNNNACSSTSQVIVTENTTIPNVSVAVDQNITCVQQEVNLDGSGTDTGADFAYLWSTVDGNILSGATGLTPLVDQGGTYTLQVTNTSSGCAASDDLNVVEDQDSPIASAGSDMEITCDQLTLNLDGSASSSGIDYAYSWSTTDGNIVSGSTSQSPLVDADGTYTIEVTNSTNGCTSTDQVLVNENTTAPTASAGADQELTCSVTSLSLDGGASDSGAGYSILWGTTDGNIVSDGATTTPIVNQPGIYTINIENTANGCTASDDVEVTQNAVVPMASAGDNQSLTCDVSSLTLDGSASESGASIVYAWTTSDGNIVSGSATQSPLIDAPGTYIIEVLNTSSGCSSQDNVQVTDDANPPAASAGSDTALSCSNPEINLDGASSETGGDIVYSWSTSDGNIISGETTQTPLVDQEGTYTMLVSNTTTGCTASDDVNVVNNMNDPVPDLGSDLSICPHDFPLTLDPGTDPAFEYDWSDGSEASQLSISAGGTYFVTVTNGACAGTDEIIVSVNSLPDPDLGGDAVVCENSLPYVLNPGSAADYAWSTGDTSNEISVSTADTYSVTVTNTDGCTASDQMSLSINPEISPAFEIPDTYCEGEVPDALASVSDNGISGTWLPTIVDTDTPGVQTLVFTPSEGECASVYSMDVNVVEVVVPQFAEFGPYCQGDEADELPAVSVNGLNGTWTPEAISTSVPGSESYLFIPDPTEKCADSMQLEVSIIEYPDAEIMIDDSVLDGQESAYLEAGAAQVYNWSPDAFLSCNDCAYPVFNAPEAGIDDQTYVLYLESANGNCSSVDSISITVLGDVPLMIPRGFSPNGDGVGDVWRIQGLDAFPDNQLDVFSRWGNLVYHASPYQNTWRGTAKTGEKLPAGTYYFTFTSGGTEPHNISGYVYITH